MKILTAEQGLIITQKRVEYNKQHPSYCAYCGGRMVWDRVTEFRRGQVIPQKLVKLCGPCLAGGKTPPASEEYQIEDCGYGHDLKVTGSSQDGGCKVCRREEKELREQRQAMEQGRGFVVGPTVKHKDRLVAHGLRRVMREKGSNGREIGEELGLSTKTVNDWANCQFRAPRAALEHIGLVLDVPVSRLTEEGAA